MHPNDFDAPTHSGARLSGTTSGSRSQGIRVFYTWDFLAEEAANEALMFAAHGLNLSQVNQRPLPILGREHRDEANWWLVSDLGAAA